MYALSCCQLSRAEDLPEGTSDGWTVESGILRTNNVTNRGVGRVEPVAGHLNGAANGFVQGALGVIRTLNIERI